MIEILATTLYCKWFLAQNNSLKRAKITFENDISLLRTDEDVLPLD